MKKIALSIASLLAITTLNGHAASLAIDIGNDVFSVEAGSKNLSQDSQFAVAMLHGDDLHLYSLKGLVTGALDQNENFEAALGAKGYFINYANENVQGLGLGGEVNYTLPMNEKIQLNGAIYYAPSPLLTDDLDNLTDLTITVSYQLLKNGTVYVNYRNIQADQDYGRDWKIDNGFNLGLQFLF